MKKLSFVYKQKEKKLTFLYYHKIFNNLWFSPVKYKNTIKHYMF